MVYTGLVDHVIALRRMPTVDSVTNDFFKSRAPVNAPVAVNALSAGVRVLLIEHVKSNEYMSGACPDDDSVSYLLVFEPHFDFERL